MNSKNVWGRERGTAVCIGSLEKRPRHVRADGLRQVTCTVYIRYNQELEINIVIIQWSRSNGNVNIVIYISK